MKLQYTFVEIIKYICSNCKLYLSNLQSQTIQSNSKWTCALLVLGMRRLNGIRQDPIGNFNKLQRVIVKISKIISLNCKIYLTKLKDIFVQIVKCICLKCKVRQYNQIKKDLCTVGSWNA